jgi:hypothetical protein
MGRDVTSQDAPAALRCLTWLLVGLTLVGAGYAAWSQGATYDEYFHLKWSERLLVRGETERLSNERWDSKTPVMIPGVLAERLARLWGVQSGRAARFASRLPTIGWLAALLALTFLFTRRYAGPRAAHLATLGLALDPSLAAHGSLATVDLAYAFASVATLAAAFRFVERPRAATGLTLGLALGLAFVAKFSAFVLLPGLALVVVCRPAERAGTRRAHARGLALAALSAWLVLCAAYFFREVGVPFGDQRWRSPALQTLAAALPGVPSPLPLAFLTGIDLSLAHERAKAFPVYLLGRPWPEGVWFYFLVLWAIKTPLLALAAQVLGLARVARAGLLRSHPALLFLALNFVWQLAYFSLLFRAQIGYRFALMCVPLAWILAGAGLATLPPIRTLRLAGAAALLVALVENALYWGNPLSFSSAAFWPKRSVFRLMADSNLDWGQNRDKIGRWLQANGIAEERLDPAEALPGTNVLSVNVLTGVKGGFQRHRWLREHVEPRRHLGHTYVWFELDDALYECYRKRSLECPEAAATRSAARPADPRGWHAAPGGSWPAAP